MVIILYFSTKQSHLNEAKGLRIHTQKVFASCYNPQYLLLAIAFSIKILLKSKQIVRIIWLHTMIVNKLYESYRVKPANRHDCTCIPDPVAKICLNLLRFIF